MLELTKIPTNLLLWNDDLARRSVLCVCDGMIQDADGTNDLKTMIIMPITYTH